MSARFEFKSAKTDGNVYLPVPTLRISGAFDDLNRAPAGCRVFPVDELGASGPLGRGRFVSLKVKAVDAAGNSAERRTMRAHGINRPLG